MSARGPRKICVPLKGEAVLLVGPRFPPYKAGVPARKVGRICLCWGWPFITSPQPSSPEMACPILCPSKLSCFPFDPHFPFFTHLPSAIQDLLLFPPDSLLCATSQLMPPSCSWRHSASCLWSLNYQALEQNTPEGQCGEDLMCCSAQYFANSIWSSRQSSGWGSPPPTSLSTKLAPIKSQYSHCVDGKIKVQRGKSIQLKPRKSLAAPSPLLFRKHLLLITNHSLTYREVYL